MYKPILETFLAVLLLTAAFSFGSVIARLKKNYWLIGYLTLLLIILTLGATKWFPSLIFLPPYSFFSQTRFEYIFVGIATTLLLSIPIYKISNKREKLLLFILIIMASGFFSICPLIAPFFIKSKLLNTITVLDQNDVCLQTTSYTCGPAAAVTALRKLGYTAHEGQISVLAYTNPFTGTQTIPLKKAIKNIVKDSKLICEYRYFNSIEELKNNGFGIVVVKYKFMIDHYVTILSVNNDSITIGDPLRGKYLLSHEEFNKIWRRHGIIIKKR